MLGLAAAAGGLYYGRSSRSDSGPDRPAPPAVATPLNPDTAEAAELVAAARRALYAAVDAELWPGSATWTRIDGVYRQAHERDPDNPHAATGIRLARAARLGRGDGDHALSKPLLAEVSVSDSRDEATVADLLLGFELLQDGSTFDAWGRFTTVLERRDGWLPARLGLALANLQAFDIVSCDVFAEARRRWPAQPSLLPVHAQCVALVDGDVAATALYLQAFHDGYRTPAAVDAFVGDELADDRAREALPVLEGLIAAHPQRADLRAAAGRVYGALHRVADAEASYRHALELAPDQLDYLLALATLYLYDLRAGLAEPLLVRADELQPGDTDVLLKLGLVYVELEQVEQAIDSFRQACQTDSANGCLAACLMGEVGCAQLSKRMQRQARSERQRILSRASDPAAGFRSYYRDRRSAVLSQ